MSRKSVDAFAAPGEVSGADVRAHGKDRIDRGAGVFAANGNHAVFADFDAGAVAGGPKGVTGSSLIRGS